MSERRMDEKDEKEVQKREEKMEEKSVEEKYRRDPVGTVAWALILIWAGLVFLGDNMGLLENLRLGRAFPGVVAFPSLEAWTVIFLGAGVILLLEVVFRLAVPAYRGPVGGSLVLGAIFLGIGLGNIYRWEIIWPLIVIALGLSILLRGLFRRRNP